MSIEIVAASKLNYTNVVLTFASALLVFSSVKNHTAKLIIHCNQSVYFDRKNKRQKNNYDDAMVEWASSGNRIFPPNENNHDSLNRSRASYRVSTRVADDIPPSILEQTKPSKKSEDVVMHIPTDIVTRTLHSHAFRMHLTLHQQVHTKAPDETTLPIANRAIHSHRCTSSNAAPVSYEGGAAVGRVTGSAPASVGRWMRATEASKSSKDLNKVG